MNLKDNFDKLPKWAQQDVKVLQMRLQEANKEIERINANEPSNTVVGHPSSFAGQQIVYLKNNQLISFLLDKGHIGIRIVGNEVEIYATEGDLTIKPRVSNSISLRLK